MKDWIKSALLSSAIVLLVVGLAWLTVGLWRYEDANKSYYDEVNYVKAYNLGAIKGYFKAVDVALEHSAKYAVECSTSSLEEIKMEYPSKPVMGDYIGR